MQDNKKDIKKQLENRFLFEDDIDALYLLLSILDNERPSCGMRPKYVSMDRILYAVKSSLSYRNDRDLIARAINKLIIDDINKLELAYYISSYTKGYENRTLSNQLECYVLRNQRTDSLKNTRYLLHNKKSAKIKRMKNFMVRTIIDEYEILSELEIFTARYCDEIILRKISGLNNILDKQLMISQKGKAVIITEERFITNWQLEKLYHRIVNSYIRSLKVLVKDAIWYGLNDRVLDRYK